MTRGQAALKQVGSSSLSLMFPQVNAYKTLPGMIAEPSSSTKGKSSKHNLSQLRRKPRDKWVADKPVDTSDQTRKPNLAQVVLVLWTKSKA